MATTKLQSRVRREQIAEAVLKLIAVKGVNGLSVAAVARRIGLVPSALYRHFRTKDQMLDAALDLIGTRLLGIVEVACREAKGHSLESLRRLLMSHVDLIRENRGIPRIVFSEDIYNGRPDRRPRVYAMICAYLDRVAEIIRRGQRLGEIRRDIGPQSAAVMFLGLVQPSAILWHMSDGGLDVTKQARRAWRVFSNAIRDRGAASRRPGRVAARGKRKGVGR